MIAKFSKIEAVKGLTSRAVIEIRGDNDEYITFEATDVFRFHAYQIPGTVAYELDSDTATESRIIVLSLGDGVAVYPQIELVMHETQTTSLTPGSYRAALMFADDSETADDTVILGKGCFQVQPNPGGSIGL